MSSIQDHLDLRASFPACRGGSFLRITQILPVPVKKTFLGAPMLARALEAQQGSTAGPATKGPAYKQEHSPCPVFLSRLSDPLSQGHRCISRATASRGPGEKREDFEERIACMASQRAYFATPSPSTPDSPTRPRFRGCKGGRCLNYQMPTKLSICVL